MAEVVNIVLFEITKCAGNFGPAMMHISSHFGEDTAANMMAYVESNQVQILSELTAIRFNWIKKGCIAVAANNWRSMLDLAYWGEY